MSEQTTELRDGPRRYTRWTQVAADEALRADLIGCRNSVTAKPLTGLVVLDVFESALTPDEARLIGVRLIEAAALADAHRAIRATA